MYIILKQIKIHYCFREFGLYSDMNDFVRFPQKSYIQAKGSSIDDYYSVYYYVRIFENFKLKVS